MGSLGIGGALRWRDPSQRRAAHGAAGAAQQSERRFPPVWADESDEPYQSGPFKESHLSEQEAINNGITE